MTAAETVRQAITAGGPEAIHAMNPVRIEVTPVAGVDLSDPATWGEECVQVGLAVDPLFSSVMEVVGATRRGKRTWSFSLRDDADPRPIAAALDAIDPRMLITSGDARATLDYSEFIHNSDMATAGQHVAELLDANSVSAAARRLSRWDPSVRFESSYRTFDPEHPGHVGVLVHVSASTLYLKVVSTSFMWEKGRDGFRQLKLSEVHDPFRLDARSYHELVHELHALGWAVSDVSASGAVEALTERLANAMLIGPSGLRPSQISTFTGAALGDEEGLCVEDRCSLSTLGTQVADALAAGREVHVDPRTTDVQAMADAIAAPHLVPGLRPYQNEAASALATTQFGMVNASAPGLGKTAMTLAGWRLRSEGVEGWRGVVVCPAAIRSQWAEEVHRFFPEATVHVARSTNEALRILDEMDDVGDPAEPVDDDGSLFAGLFADPEATPSEPREGPPVVVVVSYEVLSRCQDAFCTREWDAVCADEATVLRNHTTKRSQSLWRLRETAGVAVALTGTPIDRGVGDLGSLVSWTRNQPAWASGREFGREFTSVAYSTNAQRDFTEAMGPVLFRRDRSEVADDLPEVSTEVVLIDPSPAESRLANAARHELRRIYDELAAALDERREADPDNPDLAAASDSLASARGAVLGGVTLARMAASDPAALVGSTAAGAALLEADGLISAAVSGGSTKRTRIAQLIGELVDSGEAVLVFSDFPVVLGLLGDELAAAGIESGRVVGGQTPRERDAAVSGFQGGDLDVLLCSSAGNEGLNLQRASVVIHYDLPWNPSAVIQRVGRAVRLGSAHKHLSVLVPIMAGTIEERVAAVLIPRAATAVAALDTARGKASGETEIGIALSGLVDAVSDEEISGSLLDMARAVLGNDG